MGKRLARLGRLGDVGSMTDGELAALVLLLRQREDREALADPLRLAVHLTASAPSPHGRMVSRAHLRLISNTVVDVHAGRVDRVALSMPPQTGKSALLRWACFWWLVRNPHSRLVLASYSDSLAAHHGAAVRAMVEEFGGRFGLALAKGSRRVNDWELVSGGGLRSCGVGSALTGRPVDELAIVDDPLRGRADADSPAVRGKLVDWWSSTMLARLAPQAAVVIVQTRWHPEDLIGHVTSLPVDESGVDRPWRVLALDALCANPATDPLRRALGEPLPHPRIAEDDQELARLFWERRRATTTPLDWGALYMSNPRPREGALLSAELLRARRHVPLPPGVRRDRVAVAVDPSGSARGDECGIVGGFAGSDGRVYVAVDVTVRAAPEVWARAACRAAHRLRAGRIVVEGNYGGGMGQTVIRTAWRALVEDGEIPEGTPCPWVSLVQAQGSKVSRAEPVAQLFAEDRVRLAAVMPEFEAEWATWAPTGRLSPGRVDATVHLVHELMPYVPPDGARRREELTGEQVAELRERLEGLRRDQAVWLRKAEVLEDPRSRAEALMYAEDKEREAVDIEYRVAAWERRQAGVV
ncbi:phage terminase large subunit family protein [Kitasatospora cineracea]|uniref:phage terminase large subunit family protein n=1 Tax=Kitasatospora cineracea TaxID=88074 RepID=UPI000F4FE81D|nr:hypothetical protein [Kitasatospora cineracea]